MTRALMRVVAACVGVGVMGVAAAQTTLTRTAAFEYDPVSGLLIREISEPNDPALCLVTTYTYDVYGNKTSATLRNCNGTSGGGVNEAPAPSGNAVFASRTLTSVYAAGTQTVGGNLSWSAGQFATKTINALGHEELKEFDPRFGAVTKLTGPNGLSTTWTYDGFGRKTSENRSDGTSTTWTYNLCGACPTYGRYFITEATSGAPTKTTYFDALNREIRSEVQSFDGTLSRKDIEYDNLGRVARVSRPYYLGATPVWTTHQYDILGRVIQVDEPAIAAGSPRTTTTYNGLTTTVTVSNAGGGSNMPGGSTQTRTTTKNSQGQAILVSDSQGNTVTYTYDPFGNLKTTNAGGVVTALSYDLRGRKTLLVDPDIGTVQYDYNAVGELVWQKDAKNQVTTTTYDLLGRMTQRSEADLVSNWFFDAYQGGGSCNKGKGKLCQVTASNNYGRTISYDSQGRVATLTTSVDTSYTVSYTYDSFGRIDTTTYPTGFAVQNVYNVRGYLWKVRRVNDLDATVYWQANSMNAAGHVDSELLGNNLTTVRTYDALFRMTAVQSSGAGGSVHQLSYAFDAIGNIAQRIDTVQSITENFVYDNLNRLVSASGPGLTTRSFNYNPIGNMTYKSDVGTYTYPAVAGARPHAVSSVSNGGTPNSITASYGYDANGSLISASGTIYPSSGSVSFSRTLTYTSFNMPATVSQVQGSMSYNHTYTYSADHERVRLITVRPDDTLTSIYLHPSGKGALLYERETRQSDGRVEHKHYVTGGSGLVGVFVTKSAYGVGDGPQMRYYHRDHLGSVAVITNPSAAVLERLSYEAFGERRNANGTPQDRASPIFGVTTDRGFTAHEHLDELNLIHMNGRIYDPALGRFMTADPFVDGPTNLQGFNRYSYVRNSPLMYTDPSGYFRLRLRHIIAIAVVAFAPEISVALWGTSNAIIAGATAGFISGGISSGNLQGALAGGLTGGIFGGLGTQFGVGFSVEKVAAYAVAGGATSVMQGGSFKEGFLGAGLTQLVAPSINSFESRIGRTIAAAIVGGTAAALGGGKFANGATSAAFSRMFVETRAYAMQNSEGEKNHRVTITAYSEEKSQIGAVGHTVVTLEGPDGKATAGFWPAQPYKDNMPGLLFGMGGVLQNDANYSARYPNEPSASRTFAINATQFEAAVDALNEFAKGRLSYSLLGNQCTTAAQAVVNATGNFVNAGFPPRPSALYENLKSGN